MICTFKPCNAVSDEKTMCCLEGLQHINTIHKHVFMYCVYSIGAVLLLFFGLILMSNTCAKEKEKKEKKNLRHVNQTHS